jgi:glutamate racemase
VPPPARAWCRQEERRPFSAETTEAVREYAPLKEAGVDTVILGCTHYLICRSSSASSGAA